jgi:hypothetical protein
MNSHTLQFDEAAYAIDHARARARAGDPEGVLDAVRHGLTAVAGAPYAGMLEQAQAVGTDAVLSARAGDGERADASLALLTRLVEDMSRFEAVEVARLVL